MRVKRVRRRDRRRLAALLFISLFISLLAFLIFRALHRYILPRVRHHRQRKFRARRNHHRAPRVFVSTWPASRRPELEECISEKLPLAARRGERAPVAGSVKELGFSEPVFQQLDDLLTEKFSRYSKRVLNASHADFFYVPLPLTRVIDCMRASNEEERLKGIPRHHRIYSKTAMFYISQLYSDLVNSEEYRLATKKRYPSLIIPSTEYVREIEILSKGSPFWPNLSPYMLQLGVEHPPRCGAHDFFVQVPYPASIQFTDRSHDALSALQSKVSDSVRERVAFYSGSCTRTRMHVELCDAFHGASSQQARLYAAPVKSPLETVPVQQMHHFECLLSSVFCLQPGARALTRRDFYNAALLGCIPVLFRRNSRAYAQLLHPAVKMRRFYFVRNSADGSSGKGIVETLQQVAGNEVKRLEQNLRMALPRLMYASWQDEESDAFGAILKNLRIAMYSPRRLRCTHWKYRRH